MKTLVDGQIIKKYEVPLDMVDELNQEYDKNKTNINYIFTFTVCRIC